MFFICKLFLRNWYFLLRNWPYIRSSDGCFIISILSIKKIVTTLILYTSSRNLTRIGFLGGILEIDIIVLRLNLSRFSIFWNMNLQLMRNLMIIFVQVCGGSSIIILLNYLNSDVRLIKTSSSNFVINSNDSMSLILLAALLFLFKIVLHLLMSFM